MRMVKVEEEMEQIRFAERAARYFALHPECEVFADSDFSPGCFSALRWGINDDCVLVLKLDPHFVPTNYQNIINVKREAKEGWWVVARLLSGHIAISRLVTITK